MIKTKLLSAAINDKPISQLTDMLSAKGFLAVKCKNDLMNIEINAFHNKPQVVIINSGIYDYTTAKTLVRKLKYTIRVPFIINMFEYEERANIAIFEGLGVTRSYCAPFDLEKISDEIQQLCENIPLDQKACYDDIRKKISELLLMFNFNNSKYGYNYVRDAVFILVTEKHLKPVFCNDIYPVLAEKYETNAASIERSMRSSIASSWKNTDENIRNLFFNVKALKNKSKPTNSEFVITIAEYIRNEFKDYLELLEQQKED